MNRVISPPKSAWAELRQPLEKGEKQFIEYLDNKLHKDWEIYIQPHLNGLCPDVVILNPRVGIGVFEVKNWNFNAMDYYLENDSNGSLSLLCEKKFKPPFKIAPNPVDKILQYKREIIDLYSFGLNFQKQGALAVTVGLILPSATKEDAERLFIPLFKDRNQKVFNLQDEGGENFNHCILTKEDFDRDIQFTLPTGITRFSSKFMNPVIANQLRVWLIEPESNKEQRTPLQYNRKQKEYIEDRTKSGYRRIKGSAGSGKSVVLVSRACKLMEEKKKVLIVNFNITMLNYLKDLAVRINPNARKEATWLNFHNLCGRLCSDAGLRKQYANLFLESKTEFPDNDSYCSLINRAIDILDEKSAESEDYKEELGKEFFNSYKYDAILVDEGQDFSLKWWNILRRLLVENGEMLLVADSTQDIYEQAKVWTEDEMRGAGFRGDWVSLEGTYRLPEPLIKLVVDFAKRFLPSNMVNEPVKPKQLEMPFEKTILKWHQVGNLQPHTLEAHILRIKQELVSLQEISMNDLTILVQDSFLGEHVCSVLDKMGIKYTHIFGDSIEEKRARRMAFYKGDTRLRVCTIHSFKGWESRAILLFINKAEEIHDYALIYTGLTRLKATESSLLDVVCASPKLSEYGRTWPKQ